ncbi:hypothetical protein L6269_03950 [Candidatus Dependentiae bacterium]|nr:hypothetical protein [Candidatus Dependentiae bacterium]
MNKFKYFIFLILLLNNNKLIPMKNKNFYIEQNKNYLLEKIEECKKFIAFILSENGTLIIDNKENEIIDKINKKLISLEIELNKNQDIIKDDIDKIEVEINQITMLIIENTSKSIKIEPLELYKPPKLICAQAKKPNNCNLF